MMHSLGAVAVAVMVLVAGLGVGARDGWAGTIDPGATASGGGLGSATATIVTTSANNDNTTSASVNTITVEKTFGSLDPIYLLFTVQNSTSGTEYFVTETITNSTGVEWLDYHVALGYLTGDVFSQSGLEDQLDFDTPGRDPAPTSTAFANLSHGANLLEWDGGTVPDGGSVTFTFSLDVPNSAECAQVSEGPQCPVLLDASGAIVGYAFALRQIPTAEPPNGRVPEPASLILLASGLAALGAAGWRRRPS